MEYRAIPTQYKGIEFKSRLEADTAILLDEFWIKWEYEPASFLFSDGTHYQPDFWLAEQRLWIECRGYTSELGERQINDFIRVVRNGSLAPDRTSRPPTICDWNDGAPVMQNEYEEDDTISYLVIRDGYGDFYEYMEFDPEATSPALAVIVQCNVCHKFAFYGWQQTFYKCAICRNPLDPDYGPWIGGFIAVRRGYLSIYDGYVWQTTREWVAAHVEDRRAREQSREAPTKDSD